MGPNYRAQLSSLMRVQTCNLSFTSPDLPHYTSLSRLLLLLFLSQPETHCSSTLFPVSLSRSSHKCSLSSVGLAGSAGRALLARRASGAVVARWLVAACEGWRKYTRLKYQLGIQTHPWTKRGFLGSLFFPLCVCVGMSAFTCTHSGMFAYAMCLCVWTHGLFFSRGANALHLCTTHSMLIQTAHACFTCPLLSENHCTASANGNKREYQHNRLLAFQLRCYIIAVDTSCVR